MVPTHVFFTRRLLLISYFSCNLYTVLAFASHFICNHLVLSLQIFYQPNLSLNIKFPFQAQESVLAYYMKKDLFPFLYWNFLVKGRYHGPEFVRKIINPFGWN